MAQLDRASDYGSEGWGFESFWARHKFNRRFAGGLIYVVCPRVRTRPEGSEPQQKGRRMYAGLRQQILQGRRQPIFWARLI